MVVRFYRGNSFRDLNLLKKTLDFHEIRALPLSCLEVIRDTLVSWLGPLPKTHNATTADGSEIPRPTTWDVTKTL